MNDSMDANESHGEEFEWGIVLPGSECRDCNRLGRPRVVKHKSNGQPLDRPYRHFTCERSDCPYFLAQGRHRCWQAEIPLNSLVKRPIRRDATPV